MDCIQLLLNINYNNNNILRFYVCVSMLLKISGIYTNFLRLSAITSPFDFQLCYN